MLNNVSNLGQVSSVSNLFLVPEYQALSAMGDNKLCYIIMIGVATLCNDFKLFHA